MRSVGSGFLRGLGGPLTDGEVIDAAGLRDHGDGHARAHRRLAVVRARDDAVLTADTVLGRGTTVIDTEDGSLARLPGVAAPAARPGPRARCCPGTARTSPTSTRSRAMYLAHREQRLDQVRDALRDLGDDATARQVVEHVYTDVDEKLWDAAEWSVQAQLDYLRR